ncbi:TPA: hypothetical protein ACGF9Q_003459 [Vibrio cholerae]
MDIIIGILVGVLGSVLASVIIIFSMFNIKPNISISPEIAYGKNKDGKTTYKIKVKNNSRRSVIDISAELHLLRPFNTPNGIGRDSTLINMRKSGVMKLAPRGVSDHGEDFAFRFLTEEPLHDLWEDKDGSFLRFRLRATDSVSNHVSVFTAHYYKKEKCLKYGAHESGDALLVIPYS